MIALTLENGELLRGIPLSGGCFGFHRCFGFIAEKTALERFKMRKRVGLNAELSQWEARFSIESKQNEIKVTPIEGCTAQWDPIGKWVVKTARGPIYVSKEASYAVARLRSEIKKEARSVWLFALLLLFLGGGSLFIFRSPVVEISETSTPIQIILPMTQSVPIPLSQNLSARPLPSDSRDNEKAGGALVEQNLGFLKVLGKSDLRKIVGGTPLEMKDVSPGAGSGGKEGSGGELLIGLGKGVKQTTIGNTGTQGLGGIGHKDTGGGEGGAGVSWIGSGGRGNTLAGLGDGRRLASAVTLSQDVVLEGGLDPAVVQATIAKYVSEVRACYEAGLRQMPGLAGEVAMAFVINGKGKMDTVKVARTSLGSKGVEDCITLAMKGWVFPEPRGGVNVKVTYPFVLNPVKS